MQLKSIDHPQLNISRSYYALPTSNGPLDGFFQLSKPKETTNSGISSNPTANAQRCLFFFLFSSRLRDVYRLADHETSMQNKHENHRVELEDCTFREETKRDISVGPALGNPIGHESND